MRRNVLAGLVAAALIAVAPVAASAQSTDLQAQINALLQQIKSLQQQLTTLLTQQNTTPADPPGSPAMPRWCAIIRTLAQGAAGEDVTNLQTFLKQQGYFDGDATGYFGPLTAAAVAKWQYAEGVESAGSFGPISRALVLKKWCGGTTPAPQERFSASPTTGNAPLTVTFSTWISGFHVASTYYTIDFGDGANERAADCYSPSDWCQSPGQNTHTYLSDGTYTATLSKIIDPCAGQVACRAAIHSEIVAKQMITVGSQACTEEYAPVCGQKQVVCIKAPCNPVQQTYSNTCKMKADGAAYLYGGECKSATTNPADDARCRVWYDGCNTCSRSTPGGIAACTLRYCFQQEAAYCKAYFDDTTNNKCGVNSFSVGNACPVALGSNSLVYSGAHYQCYDGFTGTIDVQDSCVSADSLSLSAERACAARCSSTNKPPVISSFSGPTTLSVNQTGTWSVSANDPENGSLSYSVTWGDEVAYPYLLSSAGAQAAFVQNTTFTHSYATAGTYTVTIVVSDTAGQSAKTTTTVQVGSTPTACTLEYAPVCGLPRTGSNCPIGSICMMVEPVPTTYSNGCMLKAAGATYLYDGVCKSRLTCRGYDSSLKNTLRDFSEGQTTQCIPSGVSTTDTLAMSCIADASYVCRSGVWKIEGGLPPPAATGTLKGTLSIGPICPVASYPLNQVCQPSAATYASHRIYVLGPDGSNAVAATITANAPDGSFSAPLAAGDYQLQIENAYNCSASPATVIPPEFACSGIGTPGGAYSFIPVHINAGASKAIKINVDTGIR